MDVTKCMLPSSAPGPTVDPFLPPTPEAASNFGQLVHRIVQSNSGKHRALVPVPRKDREDNWAEYRTIAERTQSAGNFAHAEAMWLKAITETHAFDLHDWRRAFSFDSLAGLLYAEGRLDESEVFASKALQATLESYGEDHLKTAECEMFMGAICFSLGKLDDAIAHVKNSLVIYEAILEPVHNKIATACYNLAMIYQTRGAFEKSEELYQRAFKIRAQIFGWDHEMTTRVSKAYANMAVDRRHHRAAKEILDRLLPES